MRTIWCAPDAPGTVDVLDQTRLPHHVEVVRWVTAEDAAVGIETMQVRGAPLIGVAAAHGVALGLQADPSDTGLSRVTERLARTRPTAVNLHWALQRCSDELGPVAADRRAAAAWVLAARMADDDVATCQELGRHGAPLLAAAAQRADRPDRSVQVLTHCNAGWLAAVDWGTALAPIYAARADGVPVHVWVSETRPRNQGALTAWELASAGVPHTYVADNAAGHLLASGAVDIVLVGADRVAANGDAANKVGTYLKALAAHAHAVPFHVVAPRSTIDAQCPSGASIPIEERSADEVTHVGGVAVTPEGTPVANPAFDVTPAALITSIVTEVGPVDPSSQAIVEALALDR